MQHLKPGYYFSINDPRGDGIFVTPSFLRLNGVQKPIFFEGLQPLFVVDLSNRVPGG